MSSQKTNLLTDLSTFFSDNFPLSDFSSNFHFIRPWWLLAFFALFVYFCSYLKKIRYYQSPWQHFLPAHLANTLLENAQNNANEVDFNTKLTLLVKTTSGRLLRHYCFSRSRMAETATTRLSIRAWWLCL